MNCLSVQKRLSAYMDNEVNEQTVKEISNHLAKCTKCNYAVAAIYKQTGFPKGFREELIYRNRSTVMIVI
ncbi:zf-HC2 domain-containing protein [Clostridium sp. FP2]|uniref:anti-sigma factor family protein n=1 Tax=Clostridium sp. FP2 TaxID=2724481 RepID=UPI0013E92BD4|nr:zf-HC2 domain-containing protein [Clostridium sp. FP2]MBZ9621823.1 zf-HC2 domain-containing protein [Clostridium sp. FP2]